MAYILPVGLAVVAGLFLFIIVGEVFYLFYWRKRRLANPRVNNIMVGALRDGASVGVGEADSREVAIDVTCATYQISALHQDLVDKLFPVLGSSADSPQALMGPPRMLFTITEETREELEGLDLDGRARSRRNSRSKSMSDISLSPISTPFATPLSSPDPMATPYGTPTYSPLLPLTRSLSANSVVLKTSCRIMYDYSNTLPPAPPSPTRPSFPFLARPASPGGQFQVEDLSRAQETVDHRLSPNSNAVYYSPPRKPFVFSTSPIHSKQVESAVKPPSLMSKYMYENGSCSPSSPSSPEPFPSVSSPFSGAEQLSRNGIREQSSTPMPPFDQSTDSRTPPSETAFASNSDHPSTSSSFKPWSQRSSSVLFSSTGRPYPYRSPVLNDHIPSKAFRVSGPLSPPAGSPTLSPTWNERHVTIPFLQATTSVQ